MDFIFSLLQRKNDREAIRRRLAMGEEDDYFSNLAASRPVRKPNLQSRLQNGSYQSFTIDTRLLMLNNLSFLSRTEPSDLFHEWGGFR